jgi:predicted transcriptional regulator
MGVSKTNLFSDKQNALAMVAKAFSHPARIAIIEYLLKLNACVNVELIQELGLAQATISQHLRELKDIGIIQGTIEGSRISYCINPARWAEITQQFSEIFNQFNPSGAQKCC